MSCPAFIRVFCKIVAFNLAIIGSVRADPFFSVGPGPLCDKQTLQQAINDTNTTDPPTTEFHVLSMNGNFGFPLPEKNAIVIVNKKLHIYGGYASCDAEAPQAFDGSDVGVLSGLNGGLFPHHPTIEIQGNSDVEIRNFNFYGAANGGNNGGNGGGISYTSSGAGGYLSVQNVVITSNSAQFGAGIYYDGRGSIGDTLELFDYSIIDSNTADNGGGGIHLRGKTRLVATRPQTAISNNKVDPLNTNGHGGGLELLDNSSADIGSPGYYSFAVIDHNQAAWGGGISARDQANVRVFTTVPGSRTRIENNMSPDGGGIFLGSLNGHHPRFCAYGAGINSNETAILSIGTPDQVIPINFGDTCHPAGEASCVQGVPCNTIDGNTSADFTAAAVEGINTVFTADQIRLQGNRAGQVLKIHGNDVSSFSNCLISDNTLSSGQGVIVIGAPASFNGCTFTGDNGAISGLFSTDAPVAPFMTLENSIVSEAVVTFYNIPTSQISALNSIAGDADSYISNFNQRVRFLPILPHFLDDSPFGNYHLSGDSFAVDYYAGCTQSDLDLDGRSRGIALFPADANMPCDPGAYEHQAIPQITFPSDETFDELDPFAPELPAGWSNSIVSLSGNSGNTRGWVVTNALPFSGPFAAHAIDPGGAGAQSDSRLESPEFNVIHSGRLTFFALFSLEPGYDGAILEISIAGGAFQEMTKAGGHFVSGGYNGTLAQGNIRNPIEVECPGCPAWTWNSGPDPVHFAGYQYVEVNLPRSADGKKVVLRWRLGSDGNGPVLGGFWLDNVHVDAMPDGYIFADGFDG